MRPSLLVESSLPFADSASALTGPLGPPQRRSSLPSAASHTQNGLAPPPRSSVLPLSRMGTVPCIAMLRDHCSLPALLTHTTNAGSEVPVAVLAKPQHTIAPPSSRSVGTAETGPCG